MNVCPSLYIEKKKTILVSPPYFWFKVKDENAVLSEFLFLWFKRAEFDREACFYIDAIQKGHRIDDEIAQDLLKRGLIEGETSNYTISLGVAKASRQLPQYTKAKGLDKARLKQMVLQLLQNAGKDGARREIIYDYLKDLLPSNKSQEQQLRYLGRLLVEMNEERSIERIGLRWLLSSPSDRKQT